MVTIKNDFLGVEISEKGGEIKSVKSRSGCEYIWQGDPKSWADSAPNLFPINGRLYGDYYTFGGREYRIPMHGFIKDSQMIAKKYDGTAEFVFVSNEASRKIYPFDFEYKITFYLNDNSLTARYTVTNKGKGNMYFCLGAHPGFNLPLEEGTGDWQLDLCGAKEVKEVGLRGNFITDEITDFKLSGGKAPIDEIIARLSTSIVLLPTVKKMALNSSKSKRGITIEFPKFKYIVLWKAADAKFICIEPWTAPPSTYGTVDDFASKKDVTVLEEGGEYNCEIVYSFT